MKTKLHSIATLVLCSLFVFALPLWGLITPDGDVSLSERRPLAAFPDLNAESIQSGAFMKDFEKYTADHFPLRDTFRRLKAYSTFYLMNRRDNNGIFLYGSHAVKTEYPLNESSIDYAADRFTYVYDRYLKDSGGKVYLSVIPDKGYFVPDGAGYLKPPYDRLTDRLREKLPFVRYVDIFPLLSLDDYYTTDTHWRQERIVPVARRLAEAMGVTLPDVQYTEAVSPHPFFGVYHGQSALPLGADSLRYLESDVISRLETFDYETGKSIPVYDISRLTGNDPYEVFLSGPKSLLTVENKNTDSERELIIFRDSFGSSIAPLLAEGYRKITLVDIRYLSPAMLGDLISFEGADVLFLYSTSVLNNSITLK